MQSQGKYQVHDILDSKKRWYQFSLSNFGSMNDFAKPSSALFLRQYIMVFHQRGNSPTNCDDLFLLLSIVPMSDDFRRITLTRILSQSSPRLQQRKSTQRHFCQKALTQSFSLNVLVISRSWGGIPQTISLSEVGKWDHPAGELKVPFRT